jgi:hypothetical protein
MSQKLGKTTQPASIIVVAFVMVATMMTTTNGQSNAISLTFEAEEGLGFRPDDVSTPTIVFVIILFCFEYFF